MRLFDESKHLFRDEEINPVTDWVEGFDGVHRDPNPCHYGRKRLRYFKIVDGGYQLMDREVERKCRRCMLYKILLFCILFLVFWFTWVKSPL